MLTPEEWRKLRRNIRAEGREERITQRALFLVLGVLVVFFACWMWWGENNPHGWAGALWMGLIAALIFRAEITHGDDPEE